MKFIFDAHLDLSMNAMEWNRDLRKTIAQIRAQEKGMHDLPDRGKGTVSFPSLRAGNIGLCVATLIARYVKEKNPLPGWNSPEQAWAQTQGQLAWYRAMEQQGVLKQLTTVTELIAHLAAWEADSTTCPIGYILSLEGADSILSMEHLHQAYEAGLRALGPAHYGPGTYAFGTDSEGGIGAQGRVLLKEMEALNLILDGTHLCDQSFWEAIDVFQGPLWASHSNCRALVPNKRQLDDDQIKVIIERQGVIGMAFDAWMLFPNWIRGQNLPKESGVSLETIANHIDHICQLAGNSQHLMLGTDLDGGFGKEQCPHDLETIADLQKLEGILIQRGYTSKEVEQIFCTNGISFLKKHLPN